MTDIHGRYEIIPKIFEEEEPDYVLIGGDLTDFGPLEGIIPALEEIPAPTFVIPGNCDPKEILQVIEASGAISLHKKSIDIGRITVTGLGGSNTTPFNTLFEMGEEEMAADISKVLAKTKKNRWNILLTHAPPKGALDDIGSDGSLHVGSESVAAFAREFDIICCGHIHEQKGIAVFERRICVNPGPAFEGNYAVIRLLNEEDPVIELRNVNERTEK
ncbi:MAG: metallophosphoesterase [Methanocalculaceae archaeon]|nr:metallophosphoesterase [Methanocalculaceae archaeon]